MLKFQLIPAPAPDLKVAELTAGPSSRDERIFVDDTAWVARGSAASWKEQWTDVAIDAGHERPRGEDLGPTAKTGRERHRPAGDVGEPLLVVDVDVIRAERPRARAKDLARRHEPETRVTRDRGRRRSRLAGWWLDRRLRRDRLRVKRRRGEGEQRDDANLSGTGPHGISRRARPLERYGAAVGVGAGAGRPGWRR